MGFLGKLFDKMLDSMDNDPSRKWTVLKKHDGIFTLKGIWETKDVYLYNRPLDKEKTAQVLEVNPDRMRFDWGSIGLNAHVLAFTLLYQFMSEQETTSYVEDFCKEFIAKLPEKDFETEFNLEYWRNKKLHRRRPFTELTETEGTIEMSDDA